MTYKSLIEINNSLMKVQTWTVFQKDICLKVNCVEYCWFKNVRSLDVNIFEPETYIDAF